MHSGLGYDLVLYSSIYETRIYFVFLTLFDGEL